MWFAMTSKRQLRKYHRRCSYDPETKEVGQMMGEKSEVQFIGFHVSILLMLR